MPEGMGVILRTAGASRTKTEVKRDFEYLLRLWETVRDLTLKSTAPTLVYEEGSLAKRSIRDLYNKDIDEIVVAGDDGYKDAKDFMRMLMPSHAKNVKPYHDSAAAVHALRHREPARRACSRRSVQLRSGGYIVINQTEALVAIDVNSGRATREHHIEDTALKTNCEAAEEVARQLRLRDLAGLIVIDFIDMDEKRNNRTVERRLKDALKHDRARIQVGRISHFGLMEMSRQRIRTSRAGKLDREMPALRRHRPCALGVLGRAAAAARDRGDAAQGRRRTISSCAPGPRSRSMCSTTSAPICASSRSASRSPSPSTPTTTIGGQIAFIIDRGEQVHDARAGQGAAGAGRRGTRRSCWRTKTGRPRGRRRGDRDRGGIEPRADESGRAPARNRSDDDDADEHSRCTAMPRRERRRPRRRPRRRRRRRGRGGRGGEGRDGAAVAASPRAGARKAASRPRRARRSFGQPQPASSRRRRDGAGARLRQPHRKAASATATATARRRSAAAAGADAVADAATAATRARQRRFRRDAGVTRPCRRRMPPSSQRAARAGRTPPQSAPRETAEPPSRRRSSRRRLPPQPSCRRPRPQRAARRSRRAAARRCASPRRCASEQRAGGDAVPAPQPRAGSRAGDGRAPASRAAQAASRSGWWAKRAARRRLRRQAAMQSRWVDRDAKAAVDRYAAAGRSRRSGAAHLHDAAARRRSGAGAARRRQHLGQDARRAISLGDEVDVLCVKGSGGDMAHDRARRLARGAARRRCSSCARATTLSDEDMVRVQRANLLDPMAPNPSVETLLHAFMPHKFVDHTHANAVLSLIDQPDGAKLVRARSTATAWASCPTCMPGFAPRQGGGRDLRQATPRSRA